MRERHPGKIKKLRPDIRWCFWSQRSIDLRTILRHGLGRTPKHDTMTKSKSSSANNVSASLTGKPDSKRREKDRGVCEKKRGANVVPRCVHRGLPLHEVILQTGGAKQHQSRRRSQPRVNRNFVGSLKNHRLSTNIRKTGKHHSRLTPQRYPETAQT